MKQFLRVRVDDIARFSPASIARFLDTLARPSFVSHSFYGEDAVIHGYLRRLAFEGRILDSQSYIDIGAWRPVQGSNTYWLYERGVRGTLVEPNARLATILKRSRPGDQVLSVACGSTPRLDYFSFGPTSESNTTSREFAREIAATQGRPYKRLASVPAISLGEIIALHTAMFGQPMLLSIDAEGRNTEIMMSVDWSNHPSPPVFIITEVDGVEMAISNGDMRLPLDEWAKTIGYRTVATCGVSVVLMRADFLSQ